MVDCEVQDARAALWLLVRRLQESTEPCDADQHVVHLNAVQDLCKLLQTRLAALEERMRDEHSPLYDPDLENAQILREGGLVCAWMPDCRSVCIINLALR
jgi:hypothetical protein